MKKFIYALKWLKTVTVETRRSQLLFERDEQEGKEIGAVF